MYTVHAIQEDQVSHSSRTLGAAFKDKASAVNAVHILQQEMFRESGESDYLDWLTTSGYAISSGGILAWVVDTNGSPIQADHLLEIIKTP